MSQLLRITAFVCLFVSTLAFLINDTPKPASDCGESVDCPKYKVLNKTNDWELRQYGSTKWASTNGTAMYQDIASREMFWTLFQYIDGGNVDNVKIPMTSPVLTKVIHGAGPNCESEFVMHFMLPHSYWTNPIQPTNPKVTIVELPPIEVYVRTFGGFADDMAWETNLQKLIQSLGDDIKVEETFFYTAGYDGPYTFSHRRNEIWMQKV